MYLCDNKRHVMSCHVDVDADADADADVDVDVDVEEVILHMNDIKQNSRVDEQSQAIPM